MSSHSFQKNSTESLKTWWLRNQPGQFRTAKQSGTYVVSKTKKAKQLVYFMSPLNAEYCKATALQHYSMWICICFQNTTNVNRDTCINNRANVTHYTRLIYVHVLKTQHSPSLTAAVHAGGEQMTLIWATSSEYECINGVKGASHMFINRPTDVPLLCC